MATKKFQEYKIKNGPCELDFFHALARLQEVDFWTDSGQQFRVTICGIKDAPCKHDEADKIWDFEGHIKLSAGIAHVEGRLNYAQHRTGWIRIFG